MDDLYQKLLEAAFRFLSYRPRSEKEIRDFLTRKVQESEGTRSRALEAVVERLRELGYIDDAKFALWWQEQRMLHRPKGARAIVQELKAKGVEGRGIRVDEHALAKKAIEKKLPLWRLLPTLTQKKRAYGFLSRRGFGADTIRRIIDEVVGGRVE